MSSILGAILDDLVVDRVKHYQLENESLRARIVELQGQLESTKPEWDTTDGAHPCWWRGHDNGAIGMKAKLEKEHAARILELKANYEAELAVARQP